MHKLRPQIRIRGLDERMPLRQEHDRCFIHQLYPIPSQISHPIRILSASIRIIFFFFGTGKEGERAKGEREREGIPHMI